LPSRSETPPKDKANESAESALIELQELESELNELRANYDQYFLGIERMPPTKRHERYKRRYIALKGSFVRQTALKFRIQNLGQKVTTYERLWEKTMKQIEEGTFIRDLRKLKMKAAVKPAKQAEADFDVDEDIDISDDDVDSALDSAFGSAAAVPMAALRPVSSPAISALKPVSSPAIPALKPVSSPAIPALKPLSSPAIPALKPLSSPAIPALKPVSSPAIPALKPVSSPGISALKPVAAAIAKPSSPGAVPPLNRNDGGLSDSKMKAIYDAYVTAKQRCGEDTRSLSYDSVANTLKAQVPTLLKQHNAKSVDFKVVIKDGKAILRALPKDS
jgi:hypothetical protein